jgi:hypothetical protein
MMTLENLRPALFSHRPFTEIDRLIRAELGSGRTTGQVFDDLQAILDAALELPGLTEDGEEALLGALDALTGNCHRDCQYHDPPRPAAPGVPTSPDRQLDPRS